LSFKDFVIDVQKVASINSLTVVSFKTVLEGVEDLGADFE
jgi:hypothetical protein